ncbi:hypothetical protein GPSY_1475 [Paraglaciecola psychrophila 170]|nr:hypothetical protein GPSY_1475 [Paraglaciecola psychrophila 170]
MTVLTVLILLFVIVPDNTNFSISIVPVFVNSMAGKAALVL